ncbi:MAG: flagellar basal body rod protein FlgB [Desulfuromonas sp.]|uniref:flagellar basal body rod protein FlgB n=1 Tax=Desulfuromonas sp. TaxID=892 RepID=UPI000CAD9C7D|nr:flagellar basal body rod protein FlgB [Desulfuromonas sp.]PLX84503.1 MAG: flagellar basal body rod protein FlgB [Desulfuromonas sp.]
MPKLPLFDRTTALLGKVLDLRTRNQQVISSNIANVDTPGYAPARLEFEEGLRRAMGKGGQALATTRPEHLKGGGSLEAAQAQVLRSRDRTGLGDRNGVDVDQEMIALAENQILYEAATRMISKKLALLKYVAQDGK